LIDDITDSNISIKWFEKNIKQIDDDLLGINTIEDMQEKKGFDIFQYEDFIEEYERANNNFVVNKTKLLEAAKEYKIFLKTIKICPFCLECKEPISAHNLDDVLKGFEV
jgi:hypoxanthine phosphoribosyltransferase